MTEMILAQIPAVLALLLAWLAVVSVWFSAGGALAIAFSVTFLIMGAGVMDELLATFTVLNPGGAFLFTPALAILATVAVRDRDDAMAVRVMRLTCIAMLFFVATQLRRLGYLFVDADSPYANRVLVDLVEARNSIITLIGYYLSATMILVVRRIALAYGVPLIVKLLAPVLIATLVFTPFNIYAVMLSNPTMTPVQEQVLGLYTYAVRCGVELILMGTVFFLIKLRNGSAVKAHAEAEVLNSVVKGRRWYF